MNDTPKTLAEYNQRANAALDILKAADLTPEQRMAVYDLVNAYLFASDGCTKLHRVATELAESVREYMGFSRPGTPITGGDRDYYRGQLASLRATVANLEELAP